MAISIPEALWTKYQEAADWFIDDDHIGRNCTIVYPPKRTACSNCTVKMVGTTTINIYKHGGPQPFNFGSCGLCGGSGYHETEVTGTMRLRIYWNRADWIRIANDINIPDAQVFVIGYMSDLPKFRRATEILLAKDQNEAEYRAVLVGQPYPWGFGRNRYFGAFLKAA